VTEAIAEPTLIRGTRRDAASSAEQ